MMPSEFVILDSLPRTPNGRRLDRRALPSPELTRSTPKETYIAPRTTTEEILAEIGSNLLGVPRVGVRESFFDLGGHSLLATQFISRIRESFKVELPLRALFEGPTIEQLAKALVAIEAKPGQVEKTAMLLKKMRALSASEIESLVKPLAAAR